MLLREIHEFLDQSNISKKNIKRLTELESDDDERVASLASVLKQVALVSPGRRKRWRRLRERHRHLIHAARQSGLLDWDSFDPHSMEADEGWPSEPDDLEDDLAPENCFGVWIEPRPHEREPRCTE